MTDHFGFDSTGACQDCARGWCFAHATYTAAGAYSVGWDGVHYGTTPVPWPTSKAPESGPGNMHGWLRAGPPTKATFNWIPVQGFDYTPTLQDMQDAMALVIASLGYLPKVDWTR